MSRAISTVADTVVCLLLVSAAVFVVTTPTSDPVNAPADETAEVLATSTTTVRYAFGADATVTRRTRGTYAGLLGRAAVVNATLSGRPVSLRGRQFVARVRDETATVVGASTQVSARWRPYPGAPIAGRLTVGPAPPPRADVHVARLRVPVTVPAAEDRESYRGVAVSVSDAITRGLLPEEPAGLPQGTGVYRRAVRHRVRVLAGGRGRRARAYLRAGNARAARRTATRGLAAKLSADMRERFETPGAAAEAVTVGTATVTVRRWET